MAEKKEKPKKIEKKKKAPSFYKKKLAEKKLNKKYLKHISQSDDKAFIESCYERDGDFFLIKPEFGKKEIKRLKVLKKAIRKNRKFVINFLPLAVLAVIVAAFVIFFSIFANPLLQKALEAGLETIFEARVNAENFRVSLLSFEIAMDGLTIADRDKPMKNLIQFSGMRIKLLPAAVLRGSVYIEEIRADNIRFGTDRTVSGALPEKPPKESSPEEEFSIPQLVNLENFDAMALLNQEYDKLITPKLYDTSIEAYETSLAKWKAEREAVLARIDELKARAEPLSKINVNDYRISDPAAIPQTIEQIRTTIGQINEMISSIEAARGDVSRITSGVQNDINTLRALEQSARDAFTQDFNHLKSYLDLGSGTVLEVIEPVVMSMLTGSAELYLSYGERALEILEKIKAIQAKLPKSAEAAGEEKFTGRNVVFPARQYPKFFLGNLETDVLTPSDWLWDFDLRGVSSNPDLSGMPATLALSLAETDGTLSRRGSFNGMVDFRSSAEERFNARLSGGGFPVDISAGLSRAGIGGFTGAAEFNLNLRGNTGGGFSAGGDIAVGNAKLLDPSNTFAQAAEEAVSQVGVVNLGIMYEHIAAGDNNFSVTTNFTEILSSAFQRLVSRYISRAEEALEIALREKIEQYIDGRYLSKEELDTVFAAIRGDAGAIDALKSTLESKRNELEERIKSAAQQAAQQAVDDVRRQGEQAVEDIIHGQTPSAPTLPGIDLPEGLPNIPNPFRR